MNNKLSTFFNTIHWRWLLFTLATGSAILFLTLQSDRTHGSAQINLIPFAEHGPALACFISGCRYFRQVFWFVIIDIVGNIIVFIPFGFGLTAALQAYHGKRYISNTIILSGFFLSLMIELTQLTIPSRTTDIDDLLFNTLGTIVGLTLFFITSSWSIRKEITS